jgi:hypothetical protein
MCVRTCGRGRSRVREQPDDKDYLVMILVYLRANVACTTAPASNPFPLVQKGGLHPKTWSEARERPMAESNWAARLVCENSTRPSCRTKASKYKLFIDTTDLPPLRRERAVCRSRPPRISVPSLMRPRHPLPASLCLWAHSPHLCQRVSMRWRR